MEKRIPKEMKFEYDFEKRIVKVHNCPCGIDKNCKPVFRYQELPFELFTTFQVECDCGGEQLVIKPLDDEVLSNGVDIALWKYMFNKQSFWHRFKHIWYILKNGTPYTDQICLNLDKVKELSNFLNMYLHIAENENKPEQKDVK